MATLQRIVESKKMGIFEVPFRDKKIKVEITRKGDDIVVRRLRMV
jgi:hypothetical protein